MQDYNQAFAYVAALTQCDPNAIIIDIRMIHDTNKGVPAIPMRGTLPELWQVICNWQAQGYGAFVNISDMDGNGRETANVRASRVQVVDLDNMSAEQNMQRAMSWYPSPQFGVNSSPGKYHAYWSVPYYLDNDLFTVRQRKLRQLFDGDKRIVDSARVLRLPGTYHLKGEPFLVTCFALAGYGQITSHEIIDAALAPVNVIDGGSGGRHELGEPSLAAPSIPWLERALELTDPNQLDRGDWVAVMAAVKQSGWTLTTPEHLFEIFSAWCARYTEGNGNDIAENLKQWTSIRNTEVGWPYLARRVPQMVAEKYAPVAPMQQSDAATGPGQTPLQVGQPAAPADVLQPPPLDCSGEYLTYLEQEQWFKDCYFVTNLGKIMTPDLRFVSQTQFNGVYNGKIFIISSDGKTSKSAWEAATSGTQFKIPVVDHIRFIPFQPFGYIITDNLGRDGINVYRPAKITAKQGDPSPFLRHIAFMLPNVDDQRILLDYLAHNIKYPGHKIPWAPVIQSAEGAGKGIIKHLMDYCMGENYTYPPNAKELTDSGSKFNAWMRAKLFIMADEIKVDDKRDMIEVLKPLISEKKNEIQGKGVDQDKEDNFANWLFFTNYKDAVPINKNSRRFCIFYSAFQSAEQLEIWGLNEAYFKSLYDWLDADGGAIMYDYFINHYPLERGAIPMRAPNTSSTPEVLMQSMGPVQRMVMEAVDDQIPGFRGGWVSATAVRKRMTDLGLRTISMSGIEKIIGEMQYHMVGRSVKPFAEEDYKARSTLFHREAHIDVGLFGPAQGYH